MPDPRLATLLPDERGRVYTHPLTRELHVSSTTVLKVMAKELTRWAAALAAGEAWDNRQWLFAVTRQQAIDAFAGAPFRTRDERGDHGSYVHRGAELMAMSAAGWTLTPAQRQELSVLLSGAQGEAVQQGLFRFAEWTSKYVAEWLYLEQTVWGNGWAGTFDAIVKLKDGRVALVDYKTAKAIYREVKLQLASYRFAPWIIQADGTKIGMPDIDVAGVVHLPESGGYSFLDLEVDGDDLETFEHVLEAWQWTERVTRNPGVAIPIASADGVPGVRQCGDRRKNGSIACILEQGHAGEHQGKSKTGSRSYVWANEIVPGTSDAGSAVPSPVPDVSGVSAEPNPAALSGSIPPPAPPVSDAGSIHPAAAAGSPSGHPILDVPAPLTQEAPPRTSAVPAPDPVRIAPVIPLAGSDLDRAEQAYSAQITALFMEPK